MKVPSTTGAHTSAAGVPLKPFCGKI